MATLILNVVGRAIGGPIGAAVGATIGQIVDRTLLFKPKGREGPRLTELAVQTSSYGAPIPMIFGTMRIAGSVIWSTDLIETKKKSGGGKGSPSVTNYSYSVSFAVLLSGRPVRSVKRIWADGKLLRGAAGDFKTQTGFRLHTGEGGQAADPLIASIEGAALTPAMRGMAYAVFEHFELADYGNRIPSLTFEVEADAGPVTIGTIAEAVSDGVVTDAGVSMPLTGFSAYGDSVRGVLETLAGASGAWFKPTGDRLAMTVDGAAERTVNDEGTRAEGGGTRGAVRTRTMATIETVPRTVSVSYYDQARDYQIGVQRSRRPGAGNRSERIELPAVLPASAAKAVGEQVIARRDAARDRRMIALSWDAIDIPPGSSIAIAGEAGRWRVSGWSLEKMVTTFDLVRFAGGPSSVAATPGRVLPSPDVETGATVVEAFEIPPVDDMLPAGPRILIAATGTAAGWRRASLLTSTDDGVRWSSAGGTALPATMGVVAVPAGVAPAVYYDLINVMEVDLLRGDMVLNDADDAALDAGSNLALAGDELLQFGRAEQVSERRWRLWRLLRGRRGTEAAIGKGVAGQRFVMVDPETHISVDLPLSSIGGRCSVLASGIGDLGGPATASTPISGASVLPPSPVHGTAHRGTSGDTDVRWVRRSRAGWRWIDGVDAPIVEEREAYSLTLTSAGVSQGFETTAPVFAIAPADWPVGAALAVRQSGSFGPSLPLGINRPD